MKYDLTKMPFGKNYNDTYSQYLEFFKNLKPEDEVVNPPLCWLPMIDYCKAKSIDYQLFFQQDHWLVDMKLQSLIFNTKSNGGYRHFVEFVSTLRPELVDALWKVDNQWGNDTQTIIEHEFYMTNYNSYFRKEIIDFEKKILEYRSNNAECVITNCFADKPYPSPIHCKIKELYPDRELLIATGVFGIVPEALWGDMPHYDCGIPNFWKQKEMATKFFRNNYYSKIHVFTEFYQKSLNEVLFFMFKDSEITLEVPYKPYQDYIINEEYFCK